MSSFALNPEYAREGSGRGSSRITESGAYTGKFTKAKLVKSQGGAEGIEFDFVTEDEKKARFTVYTANKNGEPIYGEKQIHALMTVMRVRGMEPVRTKIQEYDWEAKAEIEVQASVYRELMYKPVGLVLQKEIYTNANGADKERMGFYAAFDPISRQTAAEILDKRDATALDAMLKTLRDRDSRGKGARSAGSKSAQSNDVPFDDDIPW